MTTNDAEKINNIEVLSGLVEQRMSSDRDFGLAVGTLNDDLIYIAEALRTDPLLWRQNRAFHIVHVPSFLAIMSMLDDIDQMETISDDERHQVFVSVHRAAQLAKEARQRIERLKFADTKIELEVLSEYAAKPDEPYQKPSRFTRAFGSIASASETVWSAQRRRQQRFPVWLAICKRVYPAR